MNKIKRLKFCNLCLILATISVLISSIQMEVCGGKGVFHLSFSTLMYLHSLLGLFMFLMVGIHLYLHFGKSKWIAKIRKQKSKPTKWLCVVFGIMLILSVITFIATVPRMTHSPLGAIHGKLGFIFILFCIGHTAKRWKWVKTQLFRKGYVKST